MNEMKDMTVMEIEKGYGAYCGKNKINYQRLKEGY